MILSLFFVTFTISMRVDFIIVIKMLYIIEHAMRDQDSPDRLSRTSLWGIVLREPLENQWS